MPNNQKEKTKKNKKSWKLSKAKLLTFGGILFGLGLVTSVTATYAWYSMIDIGGVTNLNLSIDLGGEGYLKLWLSKDNNKPLDQLVEGEDLIYKEDGYSKEDLGIEDITLNDVSGMFESEWRDAVSQVDQTTLPKLHTAFRQWKDYKNPGYATSENGDTYVQNVYYIEAGLDCSIYLDGYLNDEGKPHTYIQSNMEENLRTALDRGLDVDKLNEVVYAVRVSFFTDEDYVIAKVPDSRNDEETYFGGILDINGDGYYDVDSETNEEIFYGEYSGEVKRKLNLGNDEKFENGNTFLANHMPGAEIVDLENSTTLNIIKENAYDLDSLRLDDDLAKSVRPICHVHAGEMKRLVVTVYVEGWDKHMTDDINYAAFDISLSFLAVFDQPFGH